MNVKNALRDYIAASFLGDAAAATLTDDADLMEYLDSLQILRMVAEVEKRFSIQVGNDDLTAENFSSLEKLAAFVARKQRGPIDSRVDALVQTHGHGGPH